MFVGGLVGVLPTSVPHSKLAEEKAATWGTHAIRPAGYAELCLVQSEFLLCEDLDPCPIGLIIKAAIDGGFKPPKPAQQHSDRSSAKN